MRIQSVTTEGSEAPDDGGKREADSAALLVLIERLLDQQRCLAESKAKEAASADR
jgi:hypothetical protein